jgi:hypothetical protein
MTGVMTNSKSSLESLSSADLLTATRDLVAKSHGLEAELLVHLGEIDERKLYLEWAFPSMFVFCIKDLGFSECAAYNRIVVARAARCLPAVLEAVRSGQIHLAGLRLLVPHLTRENQCEVLAQAAGKSKREIEELVARLWPQPAVPAAIRKLPDRAAVASATPTPGSPAPPLHISSPLPLVSAGSLPGGFASAAAALPQRDERRATVAPLTEETFKIQFTASRGFRDKLRQAQDLLRHRVPDGDMEAILGRALDLLIHEVKKERFAVGRKVRQGSKENSDHSSRHIPDAIKRAVYERDGGRCTFTDERGRRCNETSTLEFDHIDGFARTHRHEPARMRLLCRNHNQYAADRIYGRAFMEDARASKASSTCPGASELWITGLGPSA